MPMYRIRVTAEVSDTLETWIECEAENRDVAAHLALDKANEDVEWTVAYCGNPFDHEVDSIDEIEAVETPAKE